ncbi:nuclear transport factor 2 family protein [Myroides sp. LJL115]
MPNKEQIIKEYINGYNHFDLEKMLEHLSEDIEFMDIHEHRLVIHLRGLQAFKKQACLNKEYFSSRKQIIKKITKQSHNTYLVDIHFKATLCQDLPNGLKKGENIHLKGQSTFEFKDAKIIKLTDNSQ